MDLKRVVDVAFALLALSVMAPLMIGIAIAEICEGGPIFYRQHRLGRNGRPFTLLKFRSMRAAVGGPRLTVGRDPRITRLGHVLRRTKLDELPQFFNVLRGDMSIVGPRPEVPDYLDPSDSAHRAILAHRPGITDPASLLFWNEAELLADAPDPDRCYRTKVLPAKHEISLEYAQRASLWTDLMVIGWTACGSMGLVRRSSVLAMRGIGARSAAFSHLHDGIYGPEEVQTGRQIPPEAAKLQPGNT